MTSEEKNSVIEQILVVQNELARLQNLLQDDESEEQAATPSAAFDCLAVTDAKVFPFGADVHLGAVKAMAQVVLNDQLVIRGLRVMEGVNGLFVGYPTDPFFKGEDLRTIVVPMTRQLRMHIESCVLEKYQAAVK